MTFYVKNPNNPLYEVVTYQHPDIVERLAIKLNLTTAEASSLFEDTKRYLYLCSRSNEPLGPPPMIDKAWHEFILFTRDYAEFCHSRFGFFIHHRPYTSSDVTDGSALRRTIALARESFGALANNWLAGIVNHEDCEDCAPEVPGPPSDCDHFIPVPVKFFVMREPVKL